MRFRCIQSIFFGALCFAAATGALCAQEPVQYSVSFPNASHHEARIEAVFRGAAGPSLAIRMSRSSPGRYALHEFAKNVYDVEALDGKQRPLTISRPDPYEWNVSGHDGTVVFRYTLFGDYADGTYAAIDETHAHLNAPAVFVWAKGFEDRPAVLRFAMPEGSQWRIATQLAATPEPGAFRASNLQFLMDSPVELSNHEFRDWEVRDGAEVRKFRLVVHHEGTAEEVDAWAEAVKAVVLEDRAVFGEFPKFDDGAYTFITDYLPWVHGDGMEHRNSTVCTASTALAKAGVRNVGTVAHEFFHAWNVERIRPRSLEPFDFERANMSAELWFAEGFTSYYALLVGRRARIASLDEFSASLAALLNGVNTPGRSHDSVVGMSLQAPFVDAAASVDRNNHRNTFISYYTYGAAIGLGLDLTIRTRFPGKSLDDLMRAAWNTFGKPEKPYTNADIESLLGQVTGDPAFAKDFFARHIYGKDPVAYAGLLERAGLLVRPKEKSKASLGPAAWQTKDGKLVLASNSVEGSPLYEAGLSADASLETVDGGAVKDSQSLAAILAKHKPGDTVEIEATQRGLRRKVKVRLAEEAEIELASFERAGRELPPEALRLRQEWLNSRSSTPLPDLRRYCHRCNRIFPFEESYCRYDGAELKLTPAERGKTR